MNTTTGKYLSSKDVIMNHDCSGCGACTNICPYRKFGKNSPVDIFQCTEPIGRCDLVCPMTKTDHQDLQKKNLNTMDFSPLGSIIGIYKSRAGKRFKSLFTQKKTVTALNCFILKSQTSQKILTTRIDKNLKPKPFFAENEDQVINSGKTIHSTAPVLSMVNLSKEKGYSLTGLPCQILSIAKMNTLDEKFLRPVLPEIKISLFCTWGLYPDEYSNYLKKNTGKKELNNCLIPPGKEKKIIFKFSDKSSQENKLDEIKQFIRKSCSSCTDLTGEYSDISVGDCETDSAFNTLIIRTQKGLEIVNRAVQDRYLEISPYPEEALLMLKTASLNKKKKNFS